MGHGGGKFPPTQRSAVDDVRSGKGAVRERAIDRLVQAYWKPVYKYVRFKWRASNEEAKDLTQGFFSRALEKKVFDQYDPERASFRTYLRRCLDGFVANERKAAGRKKRGGDQVVLSLDFDSAEEETRRHQPAGVDDVEQFFEREWIRALFARAVETLRNELMSEGKDACFAVFQRYDLHGAEASDAERLTYEKLGEMYGVPPTQVTNYLSLARRRFREIVLDELRMVTGSDAEFRREARSLLGVNA
jgi:RNA polymerase sigma factor (sigma-70 family)